jgi:hypothetical protein
MRSGRKIFFKSVCSHQKFLKSCSHQKVGCDITPAKLVFKNGGLLTNYPVSKLSILVFGARRIPTQCAGARNTFEEPAGMVGYSKQDWSFFVYIKEETSHESIH